ncbi:MAG: AbrB/MazE/SpoVT family DNA-binding domain-containing protein [Acidilobaceae archaeon]
MEGKIELQYYPIEFAYNLPIENLKDGWSPTPTLSRTKVGRYSRTTIPREVRKLLGISEGDFVEWVYEDGRVYVRKR